MKFNRFSAFPAVVRTIYTKRNFSCLSFCENMMEPHLGGEREKTKTKRKSALNRQLLIAAKNGDIVEVKAALEKGSDVNFVDKEGDSVLHYAVHSGSLQVVQEILDKIEDVFVDNDNNETVLTVAQHCENEEIMECLQNKIIDDGLKFLEEQFSVTTAETSNDASNFIDETISGNYKISLTLEDINTILEIEQIKGIEAISFNNLEETLDSRNSEETRTYIIQLEASKWALLDIDEERGVIYMDSFNSWRKDVIDLVEKYLEYDLQVLEWQANIHDYDSCIYVLTNAKIINSNMNDTLEQLQHRLDNTIINCGEERLFLANILNEMKRTNEKMEFCLDTLHTLNSCEKNVSEFTYRNVNAFILFLETFALEDTHPHIPEGNKREILRKLTHLKKKYYFQPENYPGKSDIELIRGARNRILHSNSKIVEPHDFTSFVAEDLRKKENGVIIFFEKLERYTKAVYDKIKNKKTEAAKINCNSFMAPLVKKPMIGQDGDLFKIDFPFLLKTYELQDIEEFMFSLTVKIIPALYRKNEVMRELNIHNFKQYKNTDEFKNMKSKLFKYYHSSEFHKILKQIKPVDDLDIINDFRQKWRMIENQFPPIENIASIEDGGGSFENKFLKSLFPEKDSDVKELVVQYLKYMAITYNQEMEVKKLSSFKRREIFESFIKLKENLLEDEKEKIFEMVKIYGIRRDLFDEIVGLYVEADEKLQHIEEESINQVEDILNFLKKIKSDFKFSNKKVILLFERFAKGLNFQGENRRLQNHFKKLPPAEILELRIGQTVIKINTFDIIIDMLEVFQSAYNIYQMKFSSIEEALTDATFLDHLINKDVCDTKKGYKFKDTFYIFMIIKKLLKEHYAAPYIAGLLIKVGNDEVIESVDLEKLIEILLDNDEFITHLDKLLHITSRTNLYDVVCRKLKNVDSLYSILKEPKHAQNILKEIAKHTDDAQKIQPFKDTLKLLNKISLEFYRKGDYDSALKLLDNHSVKSIYELFAADDKYVIIAKYQTGMIKNSLGKQTQDEKMHREAKSIFKNITKTLENTTNHYYLYSLIECSYTNYLLHEYDDKFAEEVYKTVKCYALGKGDIEESDNLIDDYNDITSSERYKDFISTSDFKKNCEILNIRGEIPHHKLKRASTLNKTDACKENKKALELYKEIYSIQKAHDPIHINHTIKNIAYAHSQIARTTNNNREREYHQHEALIKRIQASKKSDCEKQRLLSCLKDTAGLLMHSSLETLNKSLRIYKKIHVTSNSEDDKLYATLRTVKKFCRHALISRDITDFIEALRVLEVLASIQEKKFGAGHDYTKTSLSILQNVESIISNMK